MSYKRVNYQKSIYFYTTLIVEIGITKIEHSSG